MVYISGALDMAALMEQNNFRLRLKNFRFFPLQQLSICAMVAGFRDNFRLRRKFYRSEISDGWVYRFVKELIALCEHKVTDARYIR